MASIDEGYEPIGADRGGASGSAAESAPLFGAAVPRNKMSRAFLATLLGMLALGALVGLASGGPGDPAASAAPVATTTAAEDGGLAISNLAAVAADPTVLASSKSKHKGKGKGKDDKKEKTWESTKAAPLSAPNAYTNVCADPNYTKVTLKTATESTMVSLFADLHGEKKFEASDVIVVDTDFLVVYDNLWEIGRIDQNMAFRGDKNSLIHSKKGRGDDSGFEALVYAEEKKMFYVVIEAVEAQRNPFHEAKISHPSDRSPTAKAKKTNADEKAENEKSDQKQKQDADQRGARSDSDKDSYHAIIEELRMPFLFDNKKDKSEQKEEAYTLHDRCPTAFTFSSENKGFEGAVHVLHEGESILIGLCEGNYCEGGAKGREEGNGRLVLMAKREANESQPCVWETRSLLALPPTAAFADYSAIALLETNATAGPEALGKSSNGNATSSSGGKHREFHLAVTSQESSQVWMGRLRTSNKKADLSDWSLTDGVVYNFPRNDECEIEYCNIEGISFLDDNLLVAVSDKMKSGGKQHYRCLRKDQSIHTFVLP